MTYTKSLAVLIGGLVAVSLSACGSGDSSEPGGAAGNSSGSGGTTAAAGSGSGGDTVTPTSSLVGQLMINELMPSNQTTITDEAGGSADWIELFNASGDDIDLGGMYLSDAPDNPMKATLAAGLVVPAGGVLLLWADSDTEQGELHLPFNLSAAGESALISDSDGNVIDIVDYGAATPDTSYARLPDGTGDFTWCTAATPGALNGDSC